MIYNNMDIEIVGDIYTSDFLQFIITYGGRKYAYIPKDESVIKLDSPYVRTKESDITLIRESVDRFLAGFA
jgi:hypothetical protein